jgi:hypothetical protein
VFLKKRVRQYFQIGKGDMIKLYAIIRYSDKIHVESYYLIKMKIRVIPKFLNIPSMAEVAQVRFMRFGLVRLGFEPGALCLQRSHSLSVLCKPHLYFILLWLFWIQGLLILISQLARIAGMRY